MYSRNKMNGSLLRGILTKPEGSRMISLLKSIWKYRAEASNTFQTTQYQSNQSPSKLLLFFPKKTVKVKLANDRSIRFLFQHKAEEVVESWAKKVKDDCHQHKGQNVLYSNMPLMSLNDIWEERENVCERDHGTKSKLDSSGNNNAFDSVKVAKWAFNVCLFIYHAVSAATEGRL